MANSGVELWARVARLRDVLERSAPGSSTHLAGSLATGTFDAFSDIDLQWRVGSVAADLMGRIVPILGRVDPVASLRIDPDTHGLADRRLLFVRFTGWPLFWRVDIDVEGTFHAADAVGTWSEEESALMNGIGALKALHRGQADKAADLLHRGFDRIGVINSGGPLSTQVLALTNAAEARAPHLAGLAAQVYETLRTEVLRP